MTTGSLSPKSGGLNEAGGSSSNGKNSGGNLKRSQSVFDTNEKVSKFPLLIIWSLVMNCCTLGVSILFIALYWSSRCSTSIAFLFIYSIIFIGNIGFGTFFHLRFSKNWEFSPKKRNIIWTSFFMFFAISVTIFIIAIFIKEGESCSKKSQLSNLVRANGVIDLVFLAGLLFFNIVTCCSFSTEKRRKRKNIKNNVELEEARGGDNYKSKDSIKNYPPPPPQPSAPYPQQHQYYDNINNNNNNSNTNLPYQPQIINYNPHDHLPPYPSSARDNI
ncbi:hypothetical protein RB653_003090 [Dictyostelium firmibasis]|uniref:MARVEL domain-containing protein n=1 Tax=Dictyostelium firmibasis TaxID=79012 RepID=A0AAN7YW57_9MYCE